MQRRQVVTNITAALIVVLSGCNKTSTLTTTPIEPNESNPLSDTDTTVTHHSPQPKYTETQTENSVPTPTTEPHEDPQTEIHPELSPNTTTTPVDVEPSSDIVAAPGPTSGGNPPADETDVVTETTPQNPSRVVCTTNKINRKENKITWTLVPKGEGTITALEMTVKNTVEYPISVVFTFAFNNTDARPTVDTSRTLDNLSPGEKREFTITQTGDQSTGVEVSVTVTCPSI